MSEIGETRALSVNMAVLKPFLFKNMFKELIEEVFPALGLPQNSITIGLRCLCIFFNCRTSWASFSNFAIFSFLFSDADIIIASLYLI